MDTEIQADFALGVCFCRLASRRRVKGSVTEGLGFDQQCMADLHISGRLLIGMGKKLKPVELCSALWHINQAKR